MHYLGMRHNDTYGELVRVAPPEEQQYFVGLFAGRLEIAPVVCLQDVTPLDIIALQYDVEPQEVLSRYIFDDEKHKDIGRLVTTGMVFLERGIHDRLLVDPQELSLGGLVDRSARLNRVARGIGGMFPPNIHRRSS